MLTVRDEIEVLTAPPKTVSLAGNGLLDSLTLVIVAAHHFANLRGAILKIGGRDFVAYCGTTCSAGTGCNHLFQAGNLYG